MKLWKIRRNLYRGAPILGDVEAVEKTVETGNPTPLAKRVERRWLWRIVGRLLRKA
jgi:hypothetical protein